MRVMITRPREDARPLAEALAARGVESLLEPLLEIVPVAVARIDLAGVQAVMLTSANGARALAAATDVRDITVLAVGAATAAAAAGFARVETAGGDVAALADLASAVCDAAAGPLVHVAGSHVAGDLAGRLSERGFTLRRETLYTAERAEALSVGAVVALRQGAIDAVLLFSPRTAGQLCYAGGASRRDGGPRARPGAVPERGGRRGGGNGGVARDRRRGATRPGGAARARRRLAGVRQTMGWDRYGGAADQQDRHDQRRGRAAGW